MAFELAMHELLHPVRLIGVHGTMLAMDKSEDRIRGLPAQVSGMETSTRRQRTGLVALACMALLVTGCLSGPREGYYERKFRDMPVRSAYYAYREGNNKVKRALSEAKYSADAPPNARSVVMRIDGAYVTAWLSSNAFVHRTSPFSEDAAKMRATADSHIKSAMDLFSSQSGNLRKWLDNYYEIEAMVNHSNALARLAFEATGPQ
jgi:hypothetical protein